MFIVTGGLYTISGKVSQYTTNGWVRDLPDLNEGRWHHGCGYYNNEDMKRVSIRVREGNGLFGTNLYKSIDKV